jgi:hypothetical protein
VGALGNDDGGVGDPYEDGAPDPYAGVDGGGVGEEPYAGACGAAVGAA